MTLRRFFVVLGLLTPLVVPATGPAQEIQVREATQPVFPDRAFVVTLPERRRLTAADVEVTENGGPVDSVRVLGGPAAGSGVVLAIDASTSMRGKPIRDAMAAARAFAKWRRPEQKLGVVFFSGEPNIALPLTDDPAQIDAVLSKPPAITTGTELLQATKSAIDLLTDAKLKAGTVIVLSDGCRAAGGRCASSSTGALRTADVAKAAQSARVNVFSIGLRSATYDAEALQSIASPNGYIEAAGSSALRPIFRELGERFGNEYLIQYRSLAPLGSHVGVSITIDGQNALAAYQTPDLRVGRPDSFAQEESVWRSPVVAALIVLLVALLVGFALILVVRDRRRTVGERISSFVFTSPKDAGLDIEDHEGLLDAIDRALSGRKAWDRFKLDVEIARLKYSAIQIAAGTLVATIGVAAAAWFLGRPPIAAAALVGVPAAARFGVTYVAKKWRTRFAEQLPDNLQVMASALRAGHSFVGALTTMVNDAPEPSLTEYKRVLTDEQLGVPIEESLNVVGERMKNEEVGYVGLIATLQRETGGNTAEVLDRVTHTIRERMRLRRLVRTLTAQGRAGGYIVTALPIAMLIFLNVVKPDYMDPMLETTLGWIILVVAGFMVAAGAFVIRKIVDIEV